MSGQNPDNTIRILFFDYWTHGLDIFRRVVPHMEGKQVSFQLLHLGSFRDKSVPKTEVIGGIPCVDISAFEGKSLEHAISSLQPSVVIGLNIKSIVDRALLLSCANLGIPTVYLQHGFEFDGQAQVGFAKQIDKAWKITDYLERVPKYVKMLPCYAGSRDHGYFDANFWRVVWKSAIAPAASTLAPPIPSELWPTAALLFDKAYGERLQRALHMPADRIRVVGNPELDPAFARWKSPLSAEERAKLLEKLGLAPDRPIVFYPDEGLAEFGLYGWNAEVEKARMVELEETCKAAGAQLLIRPRLTDFPKFRALWSDRTDVVVSRDLSLVDMIDLSSVVIGTISTVLQTAVALRKPIFTPTWYLGSEPCSTPYLDTKTAVRIDSPGDFAPAMRRAIAGEIQLDPSLFFDRWVGNTDGTAGLSCAETILHIARSNTGAGRAF